MVEIANLVCDNILKQVGNCDVLQTAIWREIRTQCLKDKLSDTELLYEVVAVLSERLTSLQTAVRNHRDQRGDDRCWLDDLELYKHLPEGVASADLRQCSPEVMLENCKRFIASRHNPDLEYLSPQRQIENLEEELKKLKESK